MRTVLKAALGSTLLLGGASAAHAQGGMAYCADELSMYEEQLDAEKGQLSMVELKQAMGYLQVLDAKCEASGLEGVRGSYEAAQLAEILEMEDLPSQAQTPQQ